MRNREEFLKLASVKTSTFKVPSLNNYEILMKELTIAESNEFREIMSDENKKPIDAIMFACRCSCVEPTFFTDEELKNLGVSGNNAVMEIWNEIPLIGKTKDEREEYHNKMSETLKADDSAEPKTKEEISKGKKKSENSSSN